MDWCEYQLAFQPQAESVSQEFHGSMMRGAFGHALRRLACVMRRPDCHGCPIEQTCIYTAIFEPRVPATAGVMAKYPRAPAPFVLVVDPPNDRDREDIRIGLRLFGPVIKQYAVVLHAFREAAARGFGTRRQPYQLIEVSTEAMANRSDYPEPLIRSLPDPVSELVSWNILTPMRLTAGGKIMTPDQLDMTAIAMGLLRRAGLMHSFYAPNIPLPNFQELKETAPNLQVSATELAWRGLLRHSSRQKNTQSISGIIGKISIDTSKAPEWRPWLAWAPILHLGKNTTMGLGRVAAIT